MGAIAIDLFGPVSVRDVNSGAQLPVIRSALGLLAYLALAQGQPQPRERVATDLWPDSDPDRARSRLSTTLWRLRAGLGAVGADGAVRVCEATLCLDASARVDAARFQAVARDLLASPPDRERVADWRAALDACCGRGEAMAGWYDAWALRARVRLDDLRERCLGRLLDQAFALGLDDEALALADRLLAQDPLREDVHQTLIRLHLRRGRRALAARQFDRCRAVLAEELGVAPAPETLALIGAAPGTMAATAAPKAADPDQPYQALRAAIAQAQAGLAVLSREIDILIDR